MHESAWLVIGTGQWTESKANEMQTLLSSANQAIYV